MREAIFAVTMPEQRGSFRRFCELVGERSVTEFNYRISDSDRAHVFVGIQVSSPAEPDKIAANFRRHGFDTLDLTHDEMAKTHLRHMVGGRSAQARDELLYRFEFPERPGALMRFLNAMNPDWNISLFHYRNQGADYGRILIGIQVPAADKSSSAPSWPNWAIRTGTRPTTRPTSCSCSRARRRKPGRHAGARTTGKQKRKGLQMEALPFSAQVAPGLNRRVRCHSAAHGDGPRIQQGLAGRAVA